MSSIPLRLLLATHLMLGASGATLALEPVPFSRTLTETVTALSDELLDRVATEDITVRTAAAVAQMSQVVVPINEYFQHMDVVDAATIKPDGQRFPIAPNQIIKADLPNAAMFGIFEADIKVYTLIFPNVSVGDTLHYTLRIRDTKPAVPGGFLYQQAWQPSQRFDAIRVSLDSPRGLAIHIDQVGFSEESTVKLDRQVTTWSLRSLAYRPDEPNTTSLLDNGPHVTFSSFADWKGFGQAYVALAQSQAQPTAAIRSQAETITAGIADKRAQASAIYDWVSTNIRYFSVFVNRGGFAPHAADAILADRYGDCKDHATLMKALLAAKDIDADYVLINIEPIYRDQSVPGPVFDHMILYLPSFQTYADPTIPAGAFGVLSPLEADKFVLRIGRPGVTTARTPVLSAENNRLSVVVDETLSSDGSVTGSATTEAAGPLAAFLRTTYAEAATAGIDTFVKNRLERSRWRGTGSMQTGDGDHADPYRVKASYSLSTRFLDDSARGGVIPTGPTLVPAASGPMGAVLENDRRQDFVCRAETDAQTIAFRVPRGTTVSNLPKGIDEDSSLASFHSSYALADDTLRVRRLFISRVPGQVCTRQAIESARPVLDAARRDYDYRPRFVRPGDADTAAATK